MLTPIHFIESVGGRARESHRLSCSLWSHNFLVGVFFYSLPSLILFSILLPMLSADPSSWGHPLLQLLQMREKVRTKNKINAKPRPNEREKKIKELKVKWKSHHIVNFYNLSNKTVFARALVTLSDNAIGKDRGEMEWATEIWFLLICTALSHQH